MKPIFYTEEAHKIRRGRDCLATTREDRAHLRSVAWTHVHRRIRTPPESLSLARRRCFNCDGGRARDRDKEKWRTSDRGQGEWHARVNRKEDACARGAEEGGPSERRAEHTDRDYDEEGDDELDADEAEADD